MLQERAFHSGQVELNLAVGPAPGVDRLAICTSLALAEVNVSLRKQGRAELKVTESALLQQLREDGRLLAPGSEPLAADSEATRRLRLDSGRQMRAFTVSRRELLGEG
jgi:hypothetical protein